ncbi:MAG TPA: glycosyltransferase family 4 protein [Pyrinomonadaceae bacterium]
MKILLCKSHFAGPVSGSDETLVAYATHLHRQGHQLTVVLLYAPSKNDQYYVRLKQAGVEVISIISHPFAHALLKRIKSLAYWLATFMHLPARPLGMSRSLWQRVSHALSLIYQKPCHAYFERCGADMIHVITPDPGAAAMIRAGAATGIPVLYQELGTPHYLPELEIPYRSFSRVLPLCSQLAALSPRLAHQWEEKLVPANPISVLPLLVEDGFYVERAVVCSTVRFGFAARLEKGKGPLNLVDAFAEVRSKLNNTSLHIAGIGPMEQAVRMRIGEIGLTDACELRGAYKSPQEKNAFMQAVDVFVLPTLAEGTPNSIIEAMAHGLPVIASAVGGIPDLVTPDSGILIPPGDRKALANAMRQLASDSELRVRMGCQARARYEKLFSPEAVVPMLVDTYQRTAVNRNGKQHSSPAAEHPWETVTTRASRSVLPAVAGGGSLHGRRVIFVFGSLELGGAERQALILARHLVQHEHATVEVWGFNNSGPVAEICEQHGIRWRVVPYPFEAGPVSRFGSLVKLALMLRKVRPDVLLPYTLVPNTACALVWKWTGARLCIWNQRDEGLVPVNSRWQRAAVRRASQFISNSTAGSRYLTHKLDVTAAKVHVVPNGIEEVRPKLDRHTWRQQLDIDETSFVACMVANLHFNKDHQALLREWSSVMVSMQKQKRSAVLVLAGRHDNAYESLVAVTYEVGIARDVRFAGHVDDVAGLLGAADIGVFSSVSEGCPNGVLECMSVGLAVVGTNIEGIREVLGPTGAPFLASHEPGDLARIILQLADDPELRSRAGAENQLRAREHYNSRRMCEDTVSLLRKPFVF